MSLYLAIFDGGTELAGIEVGSYADFQDFRRVVLAKLENGVPGSRFPVLMLHSDCDGAWTPEEAAKLEAELMTVSESFRGMPPILVKDGWQAALARDEGIEPRTLYDCFFDIDGEPLVERLLHLARLSQSRGLPILFQ